MTAASSSRLVPPALPSPSAGGFLHDPTPTSIQAALDDCDATSPTPVSATGLGKSSDVRPALVLRHALRWAVTHADVELVGWLVGLTGRWASILDAEVTAMEDDEGWGVIGMAISSSCGVADKEEAVRLLISRFGVSPGPRAGRDRAGWTPLHLAALVSTPQIVSVLLNRGANPNAVTNAGLSAFDLISGMHGRQPLAVLLDPMHAPIGAAVAGVDKESRPPGVTISPERRALLQRRRIRIATCGAREAQRAHRARVAAERERWVRERARHIGVDPRVLLRRAPPPPAGTDGLDDDERAERDEDHDDDDDARTEDGNETDEDNDNLDDDNDTAMREADKTTMLVFSLHQLPGLFDILITKYAPVAQPRDKRALPANALYLYARFAHHQCDAVWLEELLEGAIERIERGVYTNGDDLASLAFWEYNLTLLLYLIRSDGTLSTACTELSLLTMIEELINAIHVFIIRIAERKIDEILDAAMLDFEALEDFDDVRFQDQWNLFRSLGQKKKRETPLANALFNVPNSPDGRVPALNALDSPTRHSRTRSMGRPQSIHDLKATAAAAKADAKDAIASGLEKAQAILGDKPSPRRVADILTSVHLILQLYEVNPAFIVQVFSQTFFWISSELFNRVITRKKYLCRTKAVQIRMNITALEDWTRQNGLPPNIATKHLEPVMQLLQWLQCSSQINVFDMLIGTVQSLRSLNPLQMRRAVRDYRFEVNESRMADDCNQYLAQLQRDWERRRVHIGVKAGQQGTTDGVPDEGGMPIEALFDGSVSVGEWVPQTGPECLGELLDSRFMLPFLVPEGTEFLLATPPRDAAFNNLMTDQPRLPDGSIPSRPLSRASYSSAKPMGWVMPNEQRVRLLPDDFFVWLRQKQMEMYRAWDGGGAKKAVADKPLPAAPGAGTTVELGTPSKGTSAQPQLAVLSEDYATPSRFGAPSAHSPAMQADHARKMSHDLAYKRSSEAVTPPASEAIELYPRSGASMSSINGARRAAAAAEPGSPTPQSYAVYPPNATATSAYVSSGPGSPHYELARLRRDRQASISSISSVQSSTGGNISSSPEKKKWWHSLGRMAGSGSEVDEAALRRARRREGTAETIVPDRSDTITVFSSGTAAGVSPERFGAPSVYVGGMDGEMLGSPEVESPPPFVRGGPRDRDITPTAATVGLLAANGPKEGERERVLRSKPSGVWT